MVRSIENEVVSPNFKKSYMNIEFTEQLRASVVERLLSMQLSRNNFNATEISLLLQNTRIKNCRCESCKDHEEPFLLKKSIYRKN